MLSELAGFQTAYLEIPVIFFYWFSGAISNILVALILAVILDLLCYMSQIQTTGVKQNYQAVNVNNSS